MKFEPLNLANNIREINLSRLPQGFQSLADGLPPLYPFTVDQLDVGHAVLRRPLEKRLQPADLGGVGGHHELAALLVRDRVPVAVLVRRVQTW